MKEGKVYLVGAGPSDPELLTLKGSRLLQEADVIVYDRLVGQSILLQMPEKAEKIDVGKRAGNHTMPQEQINQVLLQKAKEGKTVVRLKGGDPFLFGRGGEELELLKANGVAFEVVPGITSAISVPAYNGIPVTHRDAVSSLHIITGHKRKDAEYDIDFEALVRTKGTLVFLMGLSALEDICRGLLNAGMAPDMPSAVLQQGTTADQRRVIAPLCDLPETVKRAGIRTPAIIVVGKVCAYAEEFQWAENKPLFGCRVAVTRPRARGSRLTGMLRAMGAEVWELPSIRTVPVLPNPALQDALAKPEKYQWLVFTSPAGVEVFCDALVSAGMDMRRFARCRVASLGSGTTKALKERGIVADLQPEIFDAKHLGQALADACRAGDRLLIPRAEKGSRELLEALHGRAVEVVDLATYRTEYEAPQAVDVPAAVESGTLTAAVFTSASTVAGFVNLAQGAELTQLTAVCIGHQTEKAAREAGMKTVTAKAATLEALAQAVAEYYQNKKEQVNA